MDYGRVVEVDNWLKAFFLACLLLLGFHPLHRYSGYIQPSPLQAHRIVGPSQCFKW